MTFVEFWNNNDVTEIFVAGNGCPAGRTFTHDTDTEVDEDYCDLGELIREGGGLFSESVDIDELQGTVENGVWTWDGEGHATDVNCNDYHQIKLYC